MLSHLTGGCSKNSNGQEDSLCWMCHGAVQCFYAPHYKWHAQPPATAVSCRLDEALVLLAELLTSDLQDLEAVPVHFVEGIRLVDPAGKLPTAEGEWGEEGSACMAARTGLLAVETPTAGSSQVVHQGLVLCPMHGCRDLPLHRQSTCCSALHILPVAC